MLHLLFLLLVPFVNGDRVIQTSTGPVKGISLDTKNVEAFLGIPYAEPPVGKLRFARPVPKSPWTDTFHAKELPPTCSQGMMELTTKFFNQTDRMDEDCLHLNLWVPKSKSTLKPIMVFIHGGGFMFGSSNLKVYDGSALSHHGDVIVASMNYRVGTLGFFSAFIDEAAGSMGMYDQVLALQWIKDNAKKFGGDPDNIVLFGESAGAYSVSLHMVSPLSRSLFKRAILQSGAVFNPMYSKTNDVLRMLSQKISKLVGCASNDKDLTENPKAVVECMKSLPPEKFAEADDVLFKTVDILIPKVGDEFLPIPPVDSFRQGQFKDSELLLGVTRDEGTLFVGLKLGFENGDLFGESIDPNTFDETLAKQVTQSFAVNKHFDKIFKTYFKKAEDESRYTYLDAASEITGDFLITCAVVFQADFQSLKKHPVYFYEFDYRPPSSPSPRWVGVPHFAETPYVFGNPHGGPFSENEEELSKDIMDMWVAFAKTGNPNIPGGLTWPQYTYEDPKYLIIGARDRVGVKPDNHRCEAWRSLYRATVDDEVIQNFRD